MFPCRSDHIFTRREAGPRAWSLNLRVAFPQARSAADCPYCPFLGPSRSAFRLTLWYGHLTGCSSNSRGLITPVTGRRSLRLRSVVKVRDLSHAQTEDTRLTARGPSRSSGRTARSRTHCRSLLLLATGRWRGRSFPPASRALTRDRNISPSPAGCSVHVLWTFLSKPLARLRQARLLIAPQGCCLLRPSRPGFRLTLWCQQVARVSQQFSEFSSTPHGVAAPSVLRLYL